MTLKITKDPIPRDNAAELCAWLANAKARGAEHFAILTVPAGDQSKFYDWCDMATDACAGTKAASDNLEAWQDYRQELLYGATTTATPLTRPADNAPTAPTLTAPLLPGVMTRVRDFLQLQKRKEAWTAGMDQDFRLVPIVVEIETDTAKPKLKAKSLGGALAALSWVRGPFDAVIIEWKVDGAPAWSSLGTLTGSKFTHTAALTDPAKPENRLYRAKFMVENQIVGDWSDTVALTVRP